MKKLYAFALGLLLPGVMLASEGTYFDNYAHYEGNSTHTGNRGVGTMTISDNAGNSVTVNGTGEKGHAVYADRTSTILQVEPGATLTITGASSDKAWMHSYVYIDFGQDGKFDVDESMTSLNNDLVAFTGYTLAGNGKTGSDYDTADPTKKSDGTNTNNQDYWEIPTIQLPADMQPGTYRLRYKLDWNNVHPYGRTNQTVYGD